MVMDDERFELGKKRVLVAGDVMLDAYCDGRVSRVSPEAPVPVLLKTGERCVLGGAANVAVNLAAAGQDVVMVSAVGDDPRGSELISLLEGCGIDASGVVQVPDRMTTVKTRFVVDGRQQLLRVDEERSERISPEAVRCLLGVVESMIGSVDVVVLSDYMKGLLTPELVQGVIRIAAKAGVRVLIDVKDVDVEKYSGAFLLKPNLAELGQLTGMPVATDDAVFEAASALRVRCGCDYVLATMGARGMMLVGDGLRSTVRPEAREVFDVTGAGDTTIAYFAAALANGVGPERSMRLASAAAGVQVGKAGTSPVYLEEALEAVRASREGVPQKILHAGDVPSLKRVLEGKSVVFTNGCFDLLHVGHVRYLRRTAQLGDVLVVGLNSDESVRRLKGEGRPIIGESDRAEVLGALQYVDYVVIFDEDTPLRLIRELRPDVIAKGGDYSSEQVVGKEDVESWGGRVEIVPFVDGKSTTRIIERISEEGR